MFTNMSPWFEGVCYLIASVAWACSIARLGPEKYVIAAILLHALSAIFALCLANVYEKFRNYILLTVKVCNAVMGNINVIDWKVCHCLRGSG
jgi:hypothetical protein